ncbi:hypothetical protein R1sor_002343 [Riccia sorocarpa]|uniref:Plastid lipid-associated protein/fibrillin conserved domain-containing protein n=1 Tax=Riccia sorocarpa TaxID=122646 RepID=A0ABD3H090_9MARC
MSSSAMNVTAPPLSPSLGVPGRRPNHGQSFRFSNGIRVQPSVCEYERTGDEACSINAQFRPLWSNSWPNLQQVRGSKRSGRILYVTSAKYGEAEATSESVSTSGKSIEDVKKAVMRSVSNTNRGKNTTYQQRRSILQQLEELESLNPTSDPVNSPLFSGRWALLYTAPVDEETADKYAGTEEGPFLARVKPASFGTVKQNRSVQVIDSAAGVAENIAYFTVLGAKGNLNIRGSVTPAPRKPEGAVRVNVTFESFVLTIGNWRSPSISLSWIKPQGWVDTTFLDDDMRIGRGDKGSIFVSSRMKQDES